MVDAREKIIQDSQNVIKEQKELIAFLKTHKKNRFEELVKSLEEQIIQGEEKLKILIEKNTQTENLIKNIKNASEISIALIEQVLDELGIFKQEEK